MDNADKDNTIFTIEPIGKLEVSGELTGYLLKEAACCLFNSNLKEGRTELTTDDFKLRNP